MKICMYGLINFYDNLNNQKIDLIKPHEIIVIARVFYSCLNMVTFEEDYSDSLGTCFKGTEMSDRKSGNLKCVGGLFWLNSWILIGR